MSEHGTNPGAPRHCGRLIAALLACVLLIGCSQSPLYSQLTEQQANQVMAVLLGAGIPAEKSLSQEEDGWEVTVARGDFPRAMKLLDSRGVPHAEFASLGEIFKKEGFASSSLEERARLKFGVQQELANTLTKIDGVVDARVHVALAEKNPLGGGSEDSSASVMIFQRPGADLQSRETDLKVFIKDSVVGLDDINKVTIKFFTRDAPPERDLDSNALPVSMSAVSPLALVGIGIVLLIVLVFAFRGRLRAGLDKARAGPPQSSPGTPPTRDGVWKG